MKWPLSIIDELTKKYRTHNGHSADDAEEKGWVRVSEDDLHSIATNAEKRAEEVQAANAEDARLREELWYKKQRFDANEVLNEFEKVSIAAARKGRVDVPVMDIENEHWLDIPEARANHSQTPLDYLKFGSAPAILARKLIAAGFEVELGHTPDASKLQLIAGWNHDA